MAATVSRERSRGRIRPPLLWLVLGLGALLLVTGCERDDGTTLASEQETPEPPAIQPDDLVDLTVYFRAGNGEGGYLEPVTREVEVAEDLPRTAVELLLEGPREEDGANLEAPLPTTTRLRELSIDDETATVDLSAEVIRDADQVGASAENEFLALAALVDTLTEFPAVERVEVLVEGEAEGWRSGVDVSGFWGSWGLPPVLVRDESVIGPPREGEGVPDVEEFALDGQETGSADAEPVQVTSIRTRQRTTYLRLVVEVADSADAEASAPIPPVRARLDGEGQVELRLSDVTAVTNGLSDGDRADLGEQGVDDVEIDESRMPGELRLTLVGEARPFRLHTLSSPSRIVLDMKKQ